MERDEVVREEFPTARKGWDPDAVRAHLEAVAESLSQRATPAAEAAAERVGSIVAAAEATAAEIEADARREADSLLAKAREDAEELLAVARSESRHRVEQARGAVEGLLAQAEDLRERVGGLGESPAAAGGVRSSEVPTPQPGPTEPEPQPAPTPEPPPAPSPDPGTPEPPRPLPDRDPEPEPEPEPREPDPDPGPAADAPPSDEDLISQLKSGGAGLDAAAPAENGAAQEQPAAGDDPTAARLVAMNLALEGADREQIADRLGSEFSSLEDAEALIDDVLARAGRA